MFFNTFSIADIVDLPYYISSLDTARDSEKERQDYLNTIVPAVGPKKATNPEKILPVWLKKKRDRSDPPSPGTMVIHAFSLMRLILCIGGFIFGAAAAASFLTYTGSAPVNIGLFLFIFVFIQVVFWFFSFAALILARLNVLPGFLQMPYAFLLSFIKRAVYKGLWHLPAHKRLLLEASAGQVKLNKGTLGNLFLWPIYTLMQLAGAMVGTGVLAGTLFKVVTSDIAFGWQTTLQAAPEKIFTLVHWLALPWSWAVPEKIAYPTLAHIEGSRIILKDSIEGLLSADMAAWWPFLCLAVLVYTIVPRLLLFLLAYGLEKRFITRQLLDSNDTAQLMNILLNPHLSYGSRPVQQVQTAPVYQNIHPSPIQPHLFDNRAGERVLLVFDDAFTDQQVAGACELMRRQQYSEVSPLVVSGDIDEDAETLATIITTDLPLVAILFEAWLPPIKENIDYIKQIRKMTGPATKITIILSGKPTQNAGQSETIADKDFQIWNWKLQSLGDKNISVIGEKS